MHRLRDKLADEPVAVIHISAAPIQEGFEQAEGVQQPLYTALIKKVSHQLEASPTTITVLGMQTLSVMQGCLCCLVSSLGQTILACQGSVVALVADIVLHC